MKRKYWKVFIICCGILGLIFSLSNIWRSYQTVALDHNTTKIEQAFFATGAELHDVRVNGWVHVKTVDPHVEVLTALAQAAVSAVIEQDQQILYQTSTGPYHTTVQAIGKTSSTYVVATAQHIRPLEHPADTPETYLTINVESTGHTIDIQSLERKVKGILLEKGDQSTITTCLSGWVSGKLEEEKMAHLIRQAFHRIDARIIEGITSPTFVSYAGLSEAIDRSVKIGKNHINVNIAMRHNSKEDRTYVTAATPVITHEY